MGLDIVEVILRVEKAFSIDLPDPELSLIKTVGDLYRLVLDKLNLDYEPASLTGLLPRTARSATIHPTAKSVWLHLKAIVVDQLQVDPDEVLEAASFQYDLGAD